MTCRPPSAAEQVRFLTDIQRLLEEGSFTATYKYALLVALADLSVEKGDDSGQPLELALDDIAEKFIRCYWRQAVPYPSANGNPQRLLLKQNTGKQAAILRQIAEARSESAGSLARATSQSRDWARLRRGVRTVVRSMPLWKLQTIAGEQQAFLYEQSTSPASITLKPGVTYCFRAFHGLVINLVQGAWVRWIQNEVGNQALLGQSADLAEFLFGSEGNRLDAYKPVLREEQGGRCFYCRNALGATGRTLTTSSRGYATRPLSATTSSLPTPRVTTARKIYWQPNRTCHAGRSAIVSMARQWHGRSADAAWTTTSNRV